jgi:hypothetical protein
MVGVTDNPLGLNARFSKEDRYKLGLYVKEGFLYSYYCAGSKRDNLVLDKSLKEKLVVV